jgi:parallel beta-helix repeat protein
MRSFRSIFLAVMAALVVACGEQPIPTAVDQVPEVERQLVAATTFLVIDTKHAGPGSLRQAILDANANVGPDAIDFNIPGPGPHTIQPSTALPDITDPVVIDGLTQPVGDIVLDGTKAGSVAGLVINGTFGSRITGLGIKNFGGPGLTVVASSGNTVNNNSILDSGLSGVRILEDSDDNTVADNTIIGNGARGVVIAVGSDNNTVAGNTITDSGFGGVEMLFNSDDNTVAGNTITGSGFDGVVIAFGSDNNTVADNTITHNVFGILISQSSDNSIEGNEIAHTTGSGVLVFGFIDHRRNTIRSNSIFDNGELGIDLAPGFGVTLNDLGDGDTGPNDLQNFPVLTSALVSPGVLLVKGTIDTPNPDTVTVEFFANPAGPDPSGHGEGEVFLGAVTPKSNGKIKAVLATTVAVGTPITATATDADGNTSEFAANILAAGPMP